MSNRLSAGEKAVVTIFVAVRAAATGALGFFGNAVLGIQKDLGHLGTELAEFRTEVSARLNAAENRLDRIEGRLGRLETLIEAHHGPLPRQRTDARVSLGPAFRSNPA